LKKKCSPGKAELSAAITLVMILQKSF